MYKVVLLRHGESDWNRENRFTGWTDVDLSELGRQEAKAAGQLLKKEGYTFDQAFTSVLKRAIRTLNLALDEMGLLWIPVQRSWRLNERHYGALQGLNKAETAARHGEAQTKIWRRSFDITPPPLTIYWSERNNESILARLTEGKIRSTFFNPVTNNAYILGDRGNDSDEFDDSVILHEYAHMLAARFSRDDSPGGLHILGDMLDPRLAWSEGWANFFSSAVRGSSIYIDSKAPGQAIRYDLEEDSPANDRPGYYSEASVGGLLWDLLDDNQDNVDTAQFPFSSIWVAFTDLRNVRFVYLPYFLEAFLDRNPGFADALRAMVIRRNIDFLPGERPSVRYPFPKPLAVGETPRGQFVDSFTSKRTNLVNSSHFWSFSIPTGATATITLNIDDLGPANNPNANDLDLFLLDGNGKTVEFSNRARGGQPEMISTHLNPGTYYVEVRSFYTLGTTVFNSGGYRLSLQLR